MTTLIHDGLLLSPLREKFGDLRGRVAVAGSALVAYSGGVDSALVAFVAQRELGDHCLAVTADSPAVPRAQIEDARRFADEVGLRHEIIVTAELDVPGYRDNAANRCFFCKTELYGKMTALARQLGLAVVLDGTNADDAVDFRPGIAAGQQQGVASPLRDAGFGKDEVRELSRLLGLPTWDRPAAACLSSRVAYGVPVTAEVLARIEEGEEGLHALGFRQVRVRHHGALVRIEVGPEELPRALDPDMAARFVDLFKDLGYTLVSLDLEGYRSGSLTDALGDGRGQ